MSLNQINAMAKQQAIDNKEEEEKGNAFGPQFGLRRPAQTAVQLEAVGRNTRVRRRRQQRRRRLRAMQNNRRNVGINNNNNNGNNNNNNNRNQALERVKLSEILPRSMQHFADAVTNPFGDGAIGATCPDQWQASQIPMLDRLTFVLNPDIFNPQGLQFLQGVMLAIVPRCYAQGWLNTQAAAGTPPVEIANMRHFPLNPELSADTSNSPCFYDSYELLICGLGTPGQTGNTNDAGFMSFDTSTGQANGSNQPGINTVRFVRSDNVTNNTDSLRIMGMGLKVWSNAPPLTTGGRCYGGWIRIEDIYNSMNLQNSNSFIHKGKGVSAPAIESLLQYRCMQNGVKGATVRYSPLQDPRQEDWVAPQPTSTIEINNATEQTIVTTNDLWDPSATDLVRPGSFVPAVVWRFESPTDLYNLTVECKVHLQGKPTGECPFMTALHEPDPLYTTHKAILQNRELFPPAVSGHSFKSFMSKASRIATTVARFASHIDKFLALLDQ